ncbi:hypothetical protein CLIB1444_14S01948 [[Candida] jaroonii]|uniref:Uncharacterized protein n=1 Tax=[Candida] jaroonii TaxID=467808 RepID=A0ACA9YFK7_9ASCO|nr:hypothetical protein CLIB1444_14S01948 [[Candida] jaroonii]
MGFIIEDFGIAASVFLGLYVIYNINCLVIIYHKSWKSSYSLLLFYGMVRMGGQISGVGFSIAGYTQYNWLIAYLIMSAEGYFLLVLGNLYFLIDEQFIAWGESPLKKPLFKFSIWNRPTFRSLFHFSLLPANTFIVVSNTLLQGLSGDELKTDPQAKLSNLLRIIGQTMFLASSLLVGFFTLRSYFKGIKTKTMVVLICIIPILSVRGVYGILACKIDDMNYFNVDNYIDPSLGERMTIYEYVLSTTMEYLTASLLLNIYWVKKRFNEPHLSDLRVTADVESIPMESIDHQSKREVL